jgi:hypothetical protein
MLIENNYVRDVNPASMGAGDYGSCCAQGITGGWGWRGFAIPQTGTAPSWPHGC